MSSRRSPRPRYGRLAALASSIGVTVVSVLGGVGVLPEVTETGTQPVSQVARASVADRTIPTAEAEGATGRPAEHELALRQAPVDDSLPSGSGRGRRVVFSESAQRVWLVDRGGEVVGTWLVSGSLTDNLHPGTYEVWSRSEQAWGIDDSGTMKYFVRFAHGERAAIGFHDIPVDDGALVQGLEDLGTPRSHGCIRQRRADARRMWAFAQMGTTVVVTT